IIRNSRGTIVEQGRIQDGQLRVELPPGPYDVQVKAAKHLPFTKDVVVQKTKDQIVRAELEATTGKILIALGSLDPNLNVFIDGKAVKPRLSKANFLEIDDVPAGERTLKITHPSIADYEGTLTVQGGAETTVSPRPTWAIVNLTIKSEPGASVYVDNDFKGRVNEKGELMISALPPGERRIRAEKADFERLEQPKSFAPGDHTLTLPLKRIKFSPEYTEHFYNANAWSAPPGWRVEQRKLLVQGARGRMDVGLLKDYFYKDFRMEFNVSLTNGRGAAWVVRAQDERNYYLFHLSGSKGVSPKTFSSYVVKDGRLEQIGSTIPVVEPIDVPGEQIRILVEANGPVIKHTIGILSNPTEEAQPLSVITDATFSSGRVGFATKDEEAYTVYTITVSPIQQAAVR
ncbi:MAG TPA: hypothetical protein VNO70_06445, partial [Blastocatellia bacterium]|nr:hypothetical protein [Blastocatellia bacterium]